MSRYVVVCYANHANNIDKHKWFDAREEAERYVRSEVERTSDLFPGNDTVVFHGTDGHAAVFNNVYHWNWHILTDPAELEAS